MPCEGTLHSAQHSRFRGRPLNSTIVGGSLSFALEYEAAAADTWLPVAWSMLVPMHGSLLHLVITSEDGDDYYHLHPQGDGTDGVVTAQGVQFRRDGVHLVAVTWAVKAEGLIGGQCVDEYVSHAHSADNTGTYPMITSAWRVYVIGPNAVAAEEAAATMLPARSSQVCAKKASRWDDPRADALGLFGYDSSYAMAGSAACCACVGAHERACCAGECATRCDGDGGCLRVTARLKRVSRGWRDGDEWLDERLPLPAAQCLYVEFGVEDNGGDGAAATPSLPPPRPPSVAAHTPSPPSPLCFLPPAPWPRPLLPRLRVGARLQPYLGAAAHIFVAAAHSEGPSDVVHAHAYAAMDVERLVEVPSTLFDDCAPSARPVAPRAQGAPAHPGAPPQPLGSSPRASGARLLLSSRPRRGRLRSCPS